MILRVWHCRLFRAAAILTREGTAMTLFKPVVGNLKEWSKLLIPWVLPVGDVREAE
jgi:hypothetical protein